MRPRNSASWECWRFSSPSPLSWWRGGLTGALIQKQGVTREDTNSAFYANATFGVVVALILYFSAPAIAAFYQEPELEGVTTVMSMLFIINGLAAVQMAQMVKALRFRSLAIVSVVSVLGSGIISISLARMGYGVWSLVVQQLSRAAISTLCVWLMSAWRPGLVFSMEAFRALFSYGWRMVASNTIARAFENLYFVVVGKAYGTAELGYYSRAELLQQLPARSMSQVVGRVSFPVFASIQDQPDILRAGAKRAITMLALINFPLMAGIAVVAEPLVVALLTERWMRVVPFLQLLALAGLLHPMHSVNLGLLQALGRPDLHLRLSIVRHALVVANVAITWHLGIMAMIAGQVILSFVAFFINTFYTRATIQYGVWRQVRDVLPYAAATVAMVGVVLATRFIPLQSALLQLLVEGLAGVASYVAICALFRLPAFMELVREVSARFGGGQKPD